MIPLRTHNTSELWSWLSSWCYFSESNLRLVYSVCYFCRTLSCILYCCSQVFVLLDLCKPFTFTSHCFSGVFSTIIVLVFLAFIAIPYCSQVASSLSIMRWSCCSLSANMIVSSAYLMFVIFCPLMFIPFPPLVLLLTIVSASNIYVQLYTHLTIIYTLLQLCHTLIAPHIYF